MKSDVFLVRACDCPKVILEFAIPAPGICIVIHSRRTFEVSQKRLRVGASALLCDPFAMEEQPKNDED